MKTGYRYLYFNFVTTALIFLAPRAQAQNSCLALFVKGPINLVSADREDVKQQSTNSSQDPFKTPPLLDYAGELDARKLKAQNLQVTRDGELWDISKSMPVRLGRIKIIKPVKLFQWADRGYHRDVIQAGGIHHEWMNSILESSPQSAGVGFYVSVHPYDSASYGNALTVFEVNRPLILFELPTLYRATARPRDTIKSTEFAKRMRAAGFDGFRTENYPWAWISMINESVLLQPRAISRAEIAPFLENGIPENYQRYLLRTVRNHSDLLHAADMNSLFFKLRSRQRLTLDEASKVIFQFKLQSIKHKLFAYSEFRRHLSQVKRAEDLKDVVSLIRESNLSEKAQNEFINEIYSTPTDRNLNLKMGVLDIFDVRTLMQLGSLSRAERSQMLSEMFAQAELYNKNLQTLDGQSDDLPKALAEAGKLYGMKFEIRDEEVMMAYDRIGEKLTLPASQEAQANLNTLEHLLTVENVKSNKIEVTYATVKQIRKVFDLGSESKDWPVKKVIEVAFMRFMKSALNPGLNGKYSNPNLPPDLISKYKMLLSLHPFEDGNGRFARFFYRLIQVRFGIENAPARGLTLPVYDLDLFLTPAEFNTQLQIGALLKAWIANSKDADTFIKRSQEAIELLKTQYPHLASLMS